MVVDVGGKRARGPSERTKQEERGREESRRSSLLEVDRKRRERERGQEGDQLICIFKETEFVIIWIHLLLLDFERIEFLIKFAQRDDLELSPLLLLLLLKRRPLSTLALPSSSNVLRPIFRRKISTQEMARGRTRSYVSVRKKLQRRDPCDSSSFKADLSLLPSLFSLLSPPLSPAPTPIQIFSPTTFSLS